MRFSTVLEEYRSGRSLTFFRELHWKSSKQSADTVTKTFWSIRTNFRQETFIEWMKLAHFHDQLPLDLQRCLYDAPGVLRDDFYLALLRAKNTDVPKDTLLQRLAALQRLVGRREWKRNLLNTFSGVLSYEIMEILTPIRKAKKYTGYVRNPSSVGSKRKSKNSKPEPETFSWTSESTIDFYMYLTVGQLSSTLGDMSLPLMSTQSTKR